MGGVQPAFLGPVGVAARHVERTVSSGIAIRPASWTVMCLENMWPSRRMSLMISSTPPGKRRLCDATGALSQPWCEHEGRYGQPPPIAGGRTLPGLASRGSVTLPASPLASVAVGAGERARLRGDGLAPMINLAELGVQDSQNQASRLFWPLIEPAGRATLGSGRKRYLWRGSSP